VSRNHGTGKPADRSIELQEPIPALVKRNGYEGHVRHRHKLTGTRSLKLTGPGAVAHMSLHLKPTMSKSHQAFPPPPNSLAKRQNQADNHCSPIFCIGGLGVRLCWRPGRSSRLKRRSRPVKRPLR